MKHRPEVFRCHVRYQARRDDGPLRLWLAAATALTVLAGSGCVRPLPEPNTPAARLYASRCGQCHRTYAPGSLTAAMWQLQVELMEAKMRHDGVPPLSIAERDTILSYLTRNAAHD